MMSPNSLKATELGKAKRTNCQIIKQFFSCKVQLSIK